jgi:membrane-anchored protein YejM (alkaline phosphatase superfamily)
MGTVRPSAYRVPKWIAKMSGDLISANALAQIDNMKRQIQIQFPLLEQLEDQVKIVLAEHGVDVYQNIPNFARQVWRKKNRFSGAQLQFEANLLIQRYVAKGYTQALLERIRDVVFALAAPSP